MIRFLLSINSFLPVIIFFIIGKMDILGIKKFILGSCDIWYEYFDIGFYLILLTFSVFFSYFVLCIIKNFCNKNDNIVLTEIKPVEFTLIPVYLSLFVIVLGFSENGFTLINNMLLCILFIVWSKLEITSYFNPVWLFLGFRFYEVKTSNNTIIMLITKDRDLKGNIMKDKLIRLNNFTFLHI